MQGVNDKQYVKSNMYVCLKYAEQWGKPKPAYNYLYKPEQTRLTKQERIDKVLQAMGLK